MKEGKKTVKKENVKEKSEFEKTIEANIAKIKSQYSINTVHTIIVKDKVAYLKEPNRKTIGRALKFMKSEDDMEMVDAGEIILKECNINGFTDEVFLTDDKFILAASLQALTLIEIYEASIKKN